MQVVEVSSQREKKEFIKLPYKIHQGHRLWVPPLLSDEEKYFR